MAEQTQTGWQKAAAARYPNAAYIDGDGEWCVYSAATNSYRLFPLALLAKRHQRCELYRQLIKLELLPKPGARNRLVWEKD